MMDMTAWQEYMKLLEKLGSTLDQLTEIERNKTAAVGKGDLEAVEACMKQEQVMSLTLRGLDQKREKLLDRLGLTGVPLRELAEKGPRESFMETRQVADRVRHKYEIFQSASEVARNALECNIHAIEQIQKTRGIEDTSGAPSTPEAPREAPHIRADFRA